MRACGGEREKVPREMRAGEALVEAIVVDAWWWGAGEGAAQARRVAWQQSL